MNLPDYQKTVEVMFGKCEADYCGICTTCRVNNLIQEVWISGRRSGSASTVERKKNNWTLEEWEFAPLEWFAGYVTKNATDGQFTEQGAVLFASCAMEEMREWAGSKSPEPRKRSWDRALQGWIRRSLKGSHWHQSGGTSALPSKVSRAEAEHEETFLAAMALNSPKEPPSPCPTSSGTGSRRTPPGSRSSSQTQLKFH